MWINSKPLKFSVIITIIVNISFTFLFCPIYDGCHSHLQKPAALFLSEGMGLLFCTDSLTFVLDINEHLHFSHLYPSVKRPLFFFSSFLGRWRDSYIPCYKCIHSLFTQQLFIDYLPCTNLDAVWKNKDFISVREEGDEQLT